MLFNGNNYLFVFNHLPDCGVGLSANDLKKIVQLSIDCLRAQVVDSTEKQQLDSDVDKALHVDLVSYCQHCYLNTVM